jgi:hypothetical protein
MMREKAAAATGADRTYYETLSESPLLFPPADPGQANLFEYKAFSGEEFRAWADLFADVMIA